MAEAKDTRLIRIEQPNFTSGASIYANYCRNILQKCDVIKFRPISPSMRQRDILRVDDEGNLC